MRRTKEGKELEKEEEEEQEEEKEQKQRVEREREVTVNSRKKNGNKKGGGRNWKKETKQEKDGKKRHKEIHKFTWTQETRNLRSIIDYIIMKQRSSIRVKDVRVKRGPECGSDHRLVLAKLEFPWNGCKPVNKEISGCEKIGTAGEKLKKYKLDLLQDVTIRDLYQRRLDQKLTEFRFDSPEEIYST
ncbi:hypothetical protein LSTR_LSTR007967 [Laodelphax striatellus]|uniref:Endonuclease/exonuclease/phosphatase domain-containing protein n=1 Tax=Laodelphax striatellus TaxID=195883 RepID=A0A482WIP3_LAOST|nr:hypothetical protein LSTR_LSTR007967 [Laodelphax striatellus]